MKYYFKPVRELPTGRGFADFVFIPKPEYIQDYPAMVVELKWNRSAKTAMQQIKERHYPDSLKAYTGEILLVAVNYDKKTKVHQCLIEKYEKEGRETMTSSKEYLTGLFQAMYEELPAPKKKNVRKQI